MIQVGDVFFDIFPESMVIRRHRARYMVLGIFTDYDPTKYLVWITEGKMSDYFFTDALFFKELYSLEDVVNEY